MTRDGLTEENLRDGSVKDISHRSRGRPENKEEFVPERERKKAGNEDSKSGKGKRLQMEKIRKSSVRQEAVEDTVEVTPEEKVSGYRKKLHRHEKIPDDDNNLNSQKKSIRKKQLQKQMTKEQAKAGRLSFDDEGNQMVKGAGMKPGGTAGKYIATQAVISGMKAVTSEEEETDENAGVESARLAERETEAALRGLRHAQIRSKRTDVKTHRRGYREATVEKKLKFGSAESMEGVKHAESVKNAEQKRHFYNRFFQKKRYKDAYRAARVGKSAGSLGGATTIAGVENMTVKAKIALKEIIKRNRAMFAGIGIFALLFLVIAVSLGSCSASKAARPDATREEVLKAADEAQCKDIIDRLPDGLDTLVGTGGTYLSGGENQRIALARAILKDAPIIVLDEATAFADAENEHQIQLAFERLTQNKTVMMIAHRLSTIQDADLILVFKEGQIAERGTHEELVALNGIYSSMWKDYQTSIAWKVGKEDEQHD